MYLQEIERKFAVATVPSPVSNFTTKVIVQSYLAFDDEEVYFDALALGKRVNIYERIRL